MISNKYFLLHTFPQHMLAHLACGLTLASRWQLQHAGREEEEAAGEVVRAVGKRG